MRKVGKKYHGLVSPFSRGSQTVLPKALSPWKSRSRLAGSCSAWKGDCEVLTVRPPPGWVRQPGDYWTCPRVDFKRVTAASPSCGPPSLPRCRALHPELVECGRRPSDLGQQAAVLDGRTSQGLRRALRPPPPRSGEQQPSSTQKRRPLTLPPHAPGEGHSPGHVRQVQVLLHLQQDFPEEAQALLLELLALLKHLLHALHVLRCALAQLLQGLLVLLFAL